MSAFSTSPIQGLTDEEVLTSRAQYGWNTKVVPTKNTFFYTVLDTLKEPMVVLLLSVTGIYFATGDYHNGLFMLFAIVLVVSISLYQESKSKNAIAALSQMTQPKCKVLRNGEWMEIASDEVVIGDVFQAEEGTFVVADGTILQSNDFSVNESLLTGESLPVFKQETLTEPFVFQGTIVSSGLAICQVTAIGLQTKLGQIGKSLDAISEEKTPLQLQITHFVTRISTLGFLAFGMVWIFSYYQSQLLWESLLQALTLAMSIIPEEIPVAFTTFMALGAWRLLKHGIIAKQTKTIETLGSATVICTDKTGTLTENKMSLAAWCTIDQSQPVSYHAMLNPSEKDLIRAAMWASEPIPFDAMEIALHEAYSKIFTNDERSQYKMIHEYPLSGHPPMMTHVFENQNQEKIIACKGAPEAILKYSKLSEEQKTTLQQAFIAMMEQGFRVLGVATTNFDGPPFPEKQEEFQWDFKGLVAFYDPPKKNIKEVIKAFYRAGITVKVISGDNATTTATIAQQIGIQDSDRILNAAELMTLSEAELKEKVKHTTLFTRMFPEAKLRIIEALKANQQIVAMTGDGINDGPALKSAHIGIAMGKKGTEIAKQAANLVLIEDDLSKMIEAIAMGRKIYMNLKKAIQYIISIHIPIVLIVLLPLALGWKYPNVFSPVHIIFLEIIMGPTCSIIYENEPMERNLMQQPPRPMRTTFFKWNEIALSILQGVMITLGLILVYHIAISQSFSENKTRSLVFLTLVLSNIFLTLANRSFYFSVFTTIRYPNNLVPFIIGITLIITSILLFVPWFSSFFQFETISLAELFGCCSISIVAVFWVELYKARKRNMDTHRIKG